MLQQSNAIQVYEPVLMKRATNGKLWIEPKYLSKAATRLTDAKIRHIKHGGTFSFRWEFKDGLINVNSICERERLKYGLPDNERLVKLVEGFKTTETLERYQGNDSDNLEYEIDKVYHKMSEAKGDLHSHYNVISDKYNISKENCKASAEKWAVWEWELKNYNRSRNSNIIHHRAYNMVFQ